MLRIILNRLHHVEEYIIAEEKADFRKKRSIIEQILNCRIMAEKHIENGSFIPKLCLLKKILSSRARRIMESNETLHY